MGPKRRERTQGIANEILCGILLGAASQFINLGISAKKKCEATFSVGVARAACHDAMANKFALRAR